MTAVSAENFGQIAIDLAPMLMLFNPTQPQHHHHQAATRASWFPGNKLPDHLDGSLPGDYGFDPLSLVRWRPG